MNKTSGQQILQFQQIYYVPLFFSLRQKIYLTLNCVISTFVSCYLGNPESIIMILHEPDVALQN